MGPDDWMSPELRRIRENKKLLEQAPQMERTEFTKRLSTPVKGYRYYEGTGHCTQWEGEVTAKRLRQVPSRRKLFKLTNKQDGFSILWEPSCEDDQHAHITVCYMQNPNYGKLARHLHNAAKVIFEKQGHLLAFARADIPREDGITWSKDRRREQATYRHRFDDGKPIKVSRLFKFWCSFPRVVPRALLDGGAMEDQLAWLSDRAVAMLNDEQREALEGALHSPRRWSL